LVLICGLLTGFHSSAEMQDRKKENRKMRDKTARVENAGLEK